MAHTTRYDVKIGDFGEFTKACPASNKNKTMTTHVGTPVYMAPELMSDSRRVDTGDSAATAKKVDVYSFSVLLWQMWHLAPPYEDEPCHWRRLMEKIDR